jgi:hypothetical protein
MREQAASEQSRLGWSAAIFIKDGERVHRAIEAIPERAPLSPIPLGDATR